jgi:hypothetical protein
MRIAPCRNIPLLWLCLPAILIGLTAQLEAREERTVRQLQDLVDGLKLQMGIDAPVVTELVTTNPLLVSVKPVDGDAIAFRMSFEQSFLTGLDEDELRAIAAHELGHVWIFTHHPYLQTERLANTVAMRAVTRESLERVYSKVWEREGTKGDLTHFLGY